MRILITGARGLVGYHIAAAASPSMMLFLTSRGEDPNLGYPYLAADLTQRAEVERLLRWAEPDVVIHSAAMTLVDACQENPELCWLHNVTATRYLVETLAELRPKAQFVLVSTDFVYDGFPALQRPYVEGDYEAPISVYGASKLAAEAWVRTYPGCWAIARTALVYGWAPTAPRDNILLRVLNQLKAGRTIALFTDQVRTPTWATDLATGLLLLATEQAQGIYHLAGPTLETPYSLGQKAAAAWGLPVEKIQPLTREEFVQPAPRPPYSPLSIEKARALGYNPHTPEEAFAQIKLHL